MRYASMYTPQQREDFVRRMQRLDRYDTLDIERLREIYLGVYANPVNNS